MANHIKFSYLSRRLKNGTFHCEPQIAVALKLIEQVRLTQPEVFFELVKLCRFENYTASPSAHAYLQEANILFKGTVKDIIKDIVLSSVVGRSLQQLEITSPIHDAESAKLLTC